jgi:large subunit ribosomal protein L1
MSKIGKRLKEAKTKIESDKIYEISEAIKLAKETSKVKFDASLEVHVRLGIDPKKGDQIIRGAVVLPHGTGKDIKIAAFVTDDKAKAAKDAGAELIGNEELIEEIKKTSKTNFDIAVATPDMMPKLAAIAKILGQKGLMPNPKAGTIGPDIVKIIEELKKGKVAYKNDSQANVHILIGKMSFDDVKLQENFTTFLDSLKKSKPQSLKSTFIKNMSISSSMGPGIKVSIN